MRQQDRWLRVQDASRKPTKLMRAILLAVDAHLTKQETVSSLLAQGFSKDAIELTLNGLVTPEHWKPAHEQR